MPFDYSKLNGRIVQKYGTQLKFAEAMELSERSMSLKLNCKIGWKQSEILKACKLLEIAIVEIPDYFFCDRVQS